MQSFRGCERGPVEPVSRHVFCSLANCTMSQLLNLISGRDCRVQDPGVEHHLLQLATVSIKLSESVVTVLVGTFVPPFNSLNATCSLMPQSVDVHRWAARLLQAIRPTSKHQRDTVYLLLLSSH